MLYITYVVRSTLVPRNVYVYGVSKPLISLIYKLGVHILCNNYVQSISKCSD